eukprot:scaffold2334_cov159-Pinguiococcus_pyrenoidosus.AAC.3
MAARLASSATDLPMRIPYPGLGELREGLALVPHEEGHDAVVPAPSLGEVREFGWPLLELPRDPGQGHGGSPRAGRRAASVWATARRTTSGSSRVALGSTARKSPQLSTTAIATALLRSKAWGTKAAT